MRAISKTFFYFIFMGLLYGHTVQADIAFVSGENQAIKVGAPSEQIVVKVTDSTGNPQVGVQVTFSLTNPEGNVDDTLLIVKTIETNSTGQADTIMNFSEILGTYTLTATLTNDTTQVISTEIEVIASDAFSLAVIQGDSQHISKGIFSENIVFQLRDSFGNIVNTAGEVVEFRLENANSEIITNGLTVSSGISDDNALVTTRVNNTLTQEGIYTIIASLPDKRDNAGSATIEILPSLPNFPALGFGTMSINGILSPSNARFYGGISINGSPFEQEVVTKASSDDEVIIQVAITTDDSHIQENYDILVVAGYKANPFSTEQEQFFVLDSSGTPHPWQVLDMVNLLTFKEDVALFRNSIVEIFRGHFEFTGSIRLFFAYRLEDGTVVFNSDLAISLLLE
jgi:hypothetical protein